MRWWAACTRCRRFSRHRSPDSLTTPRLAFLATTTAQIWAQFPLAAVLLLAAMQAIPGELYEAAALDGAGGLRSFAAITLPHLQPMLVVVTLFEILVALTAFDM